MAYCDVCGNFDDANLTDVAYENPLDIKDYQPKRVLTIEGNFHNNEKKCDFRQ